MPGVLITGNYEGDRGDLLGGARWKDGYWTLEIARKLKTGSKYDKDFVARQGPSTCGSRRSTTCRPATPAIRARCASSRRNSRVRQATSVVSR